MYLLRSLAATLATPSSLAEAPACVAFSSRNIDGVDGALISRRRVGAPFCARRALRLRMARARLALIYHEIAARAISSRRARRFDGISSAIARLSPAHCRLISGRARFCLDSARAAGFDGAMISPLFHAYDDRDACCTRVDARRAAGLLRLSRSARLHRAADEASRRARRPPAMIDTASPPRLRRRVAACNSSPLILQRRRIAEIGS